MSSPSAAKSHELGTPMSGAPAKRGYYMGSLDGLRFLSFIVIFGNHLPAVAAITPFSEHGWVAVDLFFAISVFLMFRLLDAEQIKDGTINVRNFYLRRILRIYPLLIAYYSVDFIARGGFLHAMSWARLGTVLTGVDNIFTWWWGYNFTIQAVGHLWTLSYEFQIYMMLPLAFFAWKRFGTRRFMIGLALIAAVAFAVRFYAVHHGAPQIGIYVNPFFRPESILLGLALAVIKPRWHPRWSFLAAMGALTLIFVIHDPQRVWAYDASAIAAVGLVDSAVRYAPLRVLLGTRPLRYLGTISYGLYVFHIAAIWTAVRILQHPQLSTLYDRPTVICFALVGAFGVASISYRYLEHPFLKLKKRFSSIEGRAGS